MGTVQVDLGPDLVDLLAEFQRPVPVVARELVVLELYREGIVSSGRAAELLAMPRGEFIHYASARGIPYLQLSSDELRREVDDILTAAVGVDARRARLERYATWTAEDVAAFADASVPQRVGADDRWR